MSSKTFSLLVVDDEESIRESVRYVIEEENVQMAEAEDGSSAWEMIQRSHFDIVISDIRMPGEGNDGLTLLSRIQTMNPKPKVVLMTGFSDITPAAALEMGADAYLEKPFRMLKLKEILEKLLAE